MSTQTSEAIFSDSQHVETDVQSYRQISKGAVLSVVLGLLSISGFLFQTGIGLAIVGIGLGVVGYLGVIRYPDELTGKGVAIFGIVFCLITLSGATSLHAYIYLTEVPEDCVRLTFGQIKASQRGNKFKPTEIAEQMNNKKVFIKGYTFPGTKKHNLSNFLLVGDFDTCCFGGDTEPTHLIKVTIKGDQKIDYSKRLRKLSGTFKVLPRLKTAEDKPYLYELVAENIK